jgi:hypothetical protein
MEEIKIDDREAIIAEYLIGETTYRKLGAKYRIDFRRVHSWVMKYQGKPVKPGKPKIKQDDPVENEGLPNDVKQLQKELRKAKLHNQLLNAIIDIAEEQLKIDIRKKSGTKQ